MTGIRPLREEDLPVDCGAGDAAPVDCGVRHLQATRNPQLQSRIKTIVLLVFVVFLVAFVGVRLSASLQGTDFPNFYSAARMLLDGHGRQLFNAGFQRQYQSRYAGGVGTLYIHPPFEAAFYLVVAWLPLRAAYLLWFALNLVFLAMAAHCSAAAISPRWDWRILLVASLTFVPLLLCLLQGQDSLLFLLLIILAMSALQRGHAFAGGCWLGLGLCKFQIVMPLVLVLVLACKGRLRNDLAIGFGMIAVALGGFSAIISGWSVFTQYPRFLLSLQAQPSSGVTPQVMANFRGLVYVTSPHDRSSWAAVAVLILSLAALIKTLAIWKRARTTFDVAGSTRNQLLFAFAHTCLFAVLVSYYLNPHDLTLLLLPIFLLLHNVGARIVELSRLTYWMAMASLGVLFLPPLHLWALKAHVYALVGLPIVLLFLLVGLHPRPSNATRGFLKIQEDQAEN